MSLYQITATLGPATADLESWRGLVSAGATSFRLNTSHLTVVEVEEWLDRLQDADLGSSSPAVVLDLQAGKWRIGDIDSVSLEKGSRVTLVLGSRIEGAQSAGDGSDAVLPVPHEDFFRALEGADGEIRLNDAKVVLQLEHVSSDSARARVTRGGPISRAKGVSVPGSTYRVEGLGPKDRRIVAETSGRPGIGFAVSYVRDEVEMARYRREIETGVSVAAKLERGSAVDSAKAISDIADSVWLCRGDLGAELGFRDMAAAVRRFTDLVGSLDVPAILAGQVLEHMTEQEAPTRSEVCYLYDALQSGYAGVVLSDETAVGRHPIAACRAAALFR